MTTRDSAGWRPDFGGAEIYIKPEPTLLGRTFADVPFAYDDSAPMGVVTAAGELLLPPPFDRPFVAGDQIVAISEDDDTVILNGRPVALADGWVVAAPRSPTRQVERTLVLAASQRLGLDDFIISNTLVSLLVSQVSENRHLVRVFDELFTAGGHEIYLEPVADYVAVDTDLPYQAVVQAALARSEVALGFRRAAAARDPAAAYGVTVNPAKSASVRFTAADKIIVLADD